MDSVIAPLSQQFAKTRDLSAGARRALEELFSSTPLGERVVSFKFWDGEGRIVWAENTDLVGQVFGLSPDLRRAWAGEVVASFDELGGAESAAEAATGLPLLEIYSPCARSGRARSSPWPSSMRSPPDSPAISARPAPSPGGP